MPRLFAPRLFERVSPAMPRLLFARVLPAMPRLLFERVLPAMFFAFLCLTATFPSRAALAPTPAPAAVAIASYNLAVTLDATTHQLTGRETITYVNTTATPIPDLVFHLYLNAFRDPNSLFLREAGVNHRGFGWDKNYPGWIKVETLQLADGVPLKLALLEDDTLARAELPVPIAPGESVQVELTFTAQLPKVFARTGFAGDFHMVGQWFPKLGVWQDTGWNAYPFHANSEFFADFGTYDVAITLPENYVTGGTGLPVNTQPNGDGTQTVTYHAENVIDFAWTASPDFQTATRTVDGIEVLYLYLPGHEWTVARMLTAAEAALTRFNRWYGPYPYARLTIVDVPDDGGGAGGMEYPTLVTGGSFNITGINVGQWGVDRGLEVVAVHEIGHQWWQSMVAFNEAEEPWLDEGFTDYSTARAMTEAYGFDDSLFKLGSWHMGYFDSRLIEYRANPTTAMAGRAWEFTGMDYGVAAYSKPIVALSTLERTLGAETMQAVMQTFFARYQFGHPTTADFRAVAEEVSGQDLAWFFDNVVHGDGAGNWAVTRVTAHEVQVVREGDLAVPTTVRVSFADGTTTLEDWPATETELTFTYPARTITRADVDPDHQLLLDLRYSDNSLTTQADLWAWAAIVSRWVYNLQNVLLGLGGL